MCAEWAPKVRVIKYPLTWGGGSGNVFFRPTIPWRRKWQPIPVFLPGESHRQRNLADYSPWGHNELDTTEQLSMQCTPHISDEETNWKGRK